MDLVEGDPIAAVVWARRADCDLAPGKDLADDLRNVANAEVRARRADVEDFVVHCLLRGLEWGDHGAAHVLNVDEWAPGCAVALHPDLARGPGQPAQVVEDDVEAHAGRRSVRSREPKERRRE